MERSAFDPGLEGPLAGLSIQRVPRPKPLAGIGGRNAVGHEKQTDNRERHAELSGLHLPGRDSGGAACRGVDHPLRIWK